MEHKPQTSIYNTGKPSTPRASMVEKPLQPAPRELPRPGDADDGGPEDQALGAFEDPWLADIRARRIKNLLMLAVTVAVTSAITYFAVRYYDEGRTKPPPPMPTVGTPPPVIVDIEASLQLPERYLGEELLAIRPQTPPAGGIPLAIPWVKQAALSIVRAEQAAEEGRPQDAVNHYREALKIYPLLEGVRQQIGMIQLAQSQFAESEKELLLAVRENPGNAALLNNLGLAQVQLEKFDDAMASLGKALELSPEHTKAMFNLATLYVRRGDDRKAAEMFGRYLARKPSDSEAVQKYATVLMRLEEWGQAEQELAKAILLEPSVAPLHVRLAQVQAKNGNLAGCIASLRRVSELVDHRRALAWMAQTEFDEIRNEQDFKDLTEELARSAGVRAVLEKPKPRL
jgi:tetratricopeptide (TPR) repeat protein